jgi:hypothetical protein
MLGYSGKKKQRLAEIIEAVYSGKIMTIHEVATAVGRSEATTYPYIRILQRNDVIGMIKGTIERGSNNFYFCGKFTNELRKFAKEKYSKAG